MASGAADRVDSDLSHITYIYFGLFIVSCGTGDVDRGACFYIYIAHNLVRGSLSSLSPCCALSTIFLIYYGTYAKSDHASQLQNFWTWINCQSYAKGRSSSQLIRRNGPSFPGIQGGLLGSSRFPYPKPPIHPLTYYPGPCLTKLYQPSEWCLIFF